MQLADQLNIVSDQTEFLKKAAEALRLTGHGEFAGRIQQAALKIDGAMAQIAERNRTEF